MRVASPKDPTLTGTVHGTTVVLDQPVPPLEGHRVRVVLEPLDDADLALSADQQRRLWAEWVERGEQGALDDDADFPEDG